MIMVIIVRLKKIKDSDMIIQTSEYIIKNPEEYKSKWAELFGNKNNIDIEIGMGKGRFVRDMAFINPDINYIGIERMDSVIARAAQKLDTNISNLKLIRCDAEKLLDIFDINEINNIYLNFSDPWPKKRHYKRRLTHDKFLDMYKKIMNKCGRIIMKTDNIDLFEWSIESFSGNGYILENVIHDLHKTDEQIITTEYEEKFTSKNMPIYRLEVIIDTLHKN